MKGDKKNTHCYAMKVIYGRVLKAINIVASHSIDTYVPMKTKHHRTNRKIKIAPKPITTTSNLLFLKTTYEQIQALKFKISYIVNTLANQNDVLSPIIVPMEQFISFVNDGDNHIEYIDPEIINFQMRKKLKIMSGNFKGSVKTFLLM